MKEYNKIFVCIYFLCIFITLGSLSFLKKLAHAYLVRQYFSKSFGGKILPIWTECWGFTSYGNFQTQKKADHTETANIKPAHVQKGQNET